MSLIPFPQPQDEGSTYLAGLWKLEILYKVPSTGPRDTVITITILSLMQKKIPKIPKWQKNIYVTNIQKLFLKKDTQANLIRF